MPIEGYIFHRGLSNQSDYANIYAKDVILSGNIEVAGTINGTNSSIITSGIITDANIMNNGYIKFANGLIIQWKEHHIGDTDQHTLSTGVKYYLDYLPISYSNSSSGTVVGKCANKWDGRDPEYSIIGLFTVNTVQFFVDHKFTYITVGY
jgi:hypothetical protein